LQTDPRGSKQYGSHITEEVHQMKPILSTGVKLAGAAALVAIVVAGVSGVRALNAAPAEKVTICHAAGQDGTTHFVEITASYNAIYGQAGHFYEPGTPAAGHEQDYEGPCKKSPPDPK